MWDGLRRVSPGARVKSTTDKMSSRPISLTLEEWREISAALWKKMHDVGNGVYDFPISSDATPSERREHKRSESLVRRKWFKQLSTIRRKIDGPEGDGYAAAERGVAPMKH